MTPAPLLQAAGREFWKPRVKKPNPYVTAHGKPIVAVIRGGDFASMLSKGMELLGGFRKLGNDQSVLIKPNFVLPIPYPYTTSGDSILSVVGALQREEFANITISEWRSGATVGTEYPTEFDYHGVQEYAGGGNYKLLDLAGRKTRFIKDPRWRRMENVELRRDIHKAPLIINMPVLKEHDFCRFTSCIKNFVGVITPECRRQLHGGDTSIKEYLFRHMMRSVAEIASTVNPDLNIIDARQVVGVHHYDPAKGTVVDCNRVIISGDMVAADLVASKILGRALQTYGNGDANLMIRHAADLTGAPRSLDDVKVVRANV